jgi:hypothetical protein
VPSVVVGRQRLYLRDEVEAALPEMNRVIRPCKKYVIKRYRNTRGEVGTSLT